MDKDERASIFEEGYKAGVAEVLQSAKSLCTRALEQLMELETKLLGADLSSKAKTKAVKRPVKCVETGEVFDSVTSAAKAKGIARGQLNAVCLKLEKRKTAGGYHWTFV